MKEWMVQPVQSDEDFVPVKTYIPDVFVDLRYATKFNFTNQKIYDFTNAWLRYGTVKKLILVQNELKQMGLRLKILDGFRPPSAQFKLWEVCPNPTFVADPNNGFSTHSCGNTVDVTLAYADGTELVMPTEFDSFSKLASRDYRDCSKEGAANSILLEKLMEKHGFNPYFNEWWHFSDTQSYRVEESFEPMKATTCYADCNESMNLLSKPDKDSDVITRIFAGKRFEVLAKYGDFALVDYEGIFGYVPYKHVKPIE